MAKVLIVYHSRSGNTGKMALEVQKGAGEVKGVTVTVKKVADATSDDLLAADGVIIGSPVYYGTMAAEVKRLLDESVKIHGKLDGKVCGAFATAGGPHGGGETTVIDIARALLVHGMIWKGDHAGDHYGPVAEGAPDERSKAECRKLGRTVAELAKKLFG